MYKKETDDARSPGRLPGDAAVRPAGETPGLKDWGWNPEREARAAGLLPEGLRVARVTERGQDLYTVTDGAAVRHATVSGAFGYRAALPSDYPVTGDFVACRVEGDRWVVEAVLPREGTLSRKAAGRRAEEQVLAANLDVAFLVFAVDGGRGFVPRLVERLLTLVREGGAMPLILLNKADLAESLDQCVAEAQQAAPGVEVLATSARTGLNLEHLQRHLAPGRTYCLLGKSGVGKSSLVNALFGREIAGTAEVRGSDRKGRHTTSSRQLLRLPGGALLLDTPGLREAALWADEASVDEAFPDVAALAAQCRFRDCEHGDEPGCAVREALEDGTLDPERYESYLEYRREVRHHRLMGDAAAQRRERMRWKNISRLQKEISRERDKRR
ncbi:MAG: ribosome small subunit-dependent GTPase A [Spirochaetales bacterium]|nr:ribosome small subunit-dependent GTPase A [Spirochaetales bacterium]